MATATIGNRSSEEIARQQRIAAHSARVEAELREMTHRDIANVEPLPAEEEAEVLAELAKVDAPQPETIVTTSNFTFELYHWPATDSRWTLSPHELRRFEEARGNQVDL